MERIAYAFPHKNGLFIKTITNDRAEMLNVFTRLLEDVEHGLRFRCCVSKEDDFYSLEVSTIDMPELTAKLSLAEDLPSGARPPFPSCT